MVSISLVTHGQFSTRLPLCDCVAKHTKDKKRIRNKTKKASHFMTNATLKFQMNKFLEIYYHILNIWNKEKKMKQSSFILSFIYVLTDTSLTEYFCWYWKTHANLMQLETNDIPYITYIIFCHIIHLYLIDTWWKK